MKFGYIKSNNNDNSEQFNTDVIIDDAPNKSLINEYFKSLKERVEPCNTTFYIGLIIVTIIILWILSSEKETYETYSE